MDHLTLETIDRYLDGALEPADRTAVEAHLAACGACRAEVTAQRAVWSALAALSAEPLPVDLSAAVLARIAPAPAARWSAGAWLALAAQAATLVALAVWLAPALRPPLPPLLMTPWTLSGDPLAGLAAWLAAQAAVLPNHVAGVWQIGRLFEVEVLAGLAARVTTLPAPLAELIRLAGAIEGAPLVALALALGGALWLVGNRVLLAGVGEADA